MENPSKDQIDASIDAVYSEARTWIEMSQQFDEMRQVARSLALGAYDFSSLGHLIGLDDIYNDLQDRMTSLLHQGSTNFDNIANALRFAADNYAREEQETVHRMNNIY